MVDILIALVEWGATVLILLLLLHVVASYFIGPMHPIRRWLDRIIEPMLAPIRRVMPRMGMFDFSPIVLLILIRIIEEILVRILITLR
jgi:YggT family protein